MRDVPLSDILVYARRFLAALLSGSLLYAAFDHERPLWPLIFIALLPLEWALKGVRPLEALAYGFTTFFLFLSVNLWWLSKWGVMSCLGLVFMEAMAYAIMVAFYAWLRQRLGRDPWHLLLPACLILVEYKRNIGLWAFPWPMLGHALVYSNVLLQFAAVVGVMGLSFIVVWGNAVLSSLLLEDVRPATRRWPEARPFVLVLALMGVYGIVTLAEAPYLQRQRPEIPVTVTQRTASTLDAWDGAFIQRAKQEYLGLTREHLETIGRIPKPGVMQAPFAADPAKPMGLVVWPEGALPNAWLAANELQLFSNQANAVLIYGSAYPGLQDGPEPGAPGLEVLDEGTRLGLDLARAMGQKIRYYNSVEIRAPGETNPIGITNKYHLVPFGETFPLKKFISLVENPWGDAESMKAGLRLRAVPTPVGKVGIVVCYESFFAPIVRKLVKDGAEILVLSSNTSWFGKYYSATYQHAYYDRARAVEYRIPFVRAATTGVSSIIDPWGRELAITEPHEGSRLPGDPATGPEGTCRSANIVPRRGFSAYTVLGDWVVGTSAAYLFAILLWCWFPGSLLALAKGYGVEREGRQRRRAEPVQSIQ